MLKRLLFPVLLALVALPAWAASEFVLQGMDGAEHRLSDYRGKWVVVNYWATWCPPCREEIPELVHFHEKHKDTAVVLGVIMEDIDRAYLAEFIEEYLVSYPVLDGMSGNAALGPVPGLPTTYLVAPDGTIAGRQVGLVTAEGLESFINGRNKK